MDTVGSIRAEEEVMSTGNVAFTFQGMIVLFMSRDVALQKSPEQIP